MDVAITKSKNQHGVESLSIKFPQPLTKAMLERGYNRATIKVTEEGILVEPYVASNGHSPPVELPDWEGKG